MRATGGGGGGYFRASHSFGQGRLPATPSSLCPQFVKLTLPVLQTPSARPTQCHSSPWRPRGTHCPATWRSPSCSHLPLSAPLTLLSSEKRGESGGGRRGRGRPSIQAAPRSFHGQQTGVEPRVVQEKSPSRARSPKAWIPAVRPWACVFPSLRNKECRRPSL